MKANILSTAKIGKTHGLEGFLRIYSFSGEYNHLKKLEKCNVKLPDGISKALDIDSFRIQGDLYLIRFSGFDTPEKARNLSNGIIEIEREKAPKLKKGEYYVADLYQMEVFSCGKNIGKVIDTIDGPQAILLEILKYESGKTHLVPLLPVYISDVDVDGNKMNLLMPELLD